MVDLDFTGDTVRVGELGIRTPGLTGTADTPDLPGEGLRAAGGTSDELQDALRRAEMTTTHQLDLSASELDMGDRRSRRDASRGRIGTIELDVPTPNDDEEQAVVSVDEAGIVTWSFAPRRERTAAVRSGLETRTFVIERHAAEGDAGDGGTRSVIGEIGKQVLKVIAFPVGDKVGRMANSFLGQWEAEHMDYGVRDFGPDTFREAPVYFNDDPNRWTDLAAGRTLLFIHGTHSRAQGAFGALPDVQMARFKQLYGDRIIAFDHRTLSENPIENIEWFVDQVPEGRQLDVDIVCHSRGGLVARALAEWQGAVPGNRQIRVRRLALVGATNNGTILADVKHWNDMVNVLTTVMNLLGVAIGDSIDLVLSFVRQIAVAAYPRIRGLSAMVPNGPFLTDFNSRPLGKAEYLAIGSNYEPTEPRLKDYFNDYVKDVVFKGKENDAMVRVDSICGSPEAGGFQPVKQNLVLPSLRGIEHSYYFGQPDVADELVAFFQAGLP
jgi:pimeloyl-ACP methyl ester carboxylesterase